MRQVYHIHPLRGNPRAGRRALRATFGRRATSLIVVALIAACEAPPKPGNILVVQPGDFETKGDGKLFRVDAKSGARTVLSDFGDPAQGTEGVDPFDVAVEPTGQILVTDPKGLGANANGKLFRIEPASGKRSVLSDFGDTTQGPAGVDPFGVTVERTGQILVADSQSGTDSNGALFRVDPKSGARAVLSDFGDSAKGTPLGKIGGVAVEPSGNILVTGFDTGTDSNGVLFRVDATSGARTVLSDFGNPAQGPEGVVREIPFPFIDMALESSGSILVTILETGTDRKGALFRVDPKSGDRRIQSDFGNNAQGSLGQNPVGVAVVSEKMY